MPIPRCIVLQGDATKFEGHADLIFTHPYGPIPPQLHGKPALINLYHPPGMAQHVRTREAEAWLGGAKLLPCGWWGHRLRNCLYVANAPQRAINAQFMLEDKQPGGWGAMPIELCTMALERYADIFRGDLTVWDGFAGRGTIGRAVLRRPELCYFGIEIDPKQHERACRYLIETPWLEVIIDSWVEADGRVMKRIYQWAPTSSAS